MFSTLIIRLIVLVMDLKWETKWEGTQLRSGWFPCLMHSLNNSVSLMEIRSQQRSGDMGHSVASVWQLNSLGKTMEQKVKKSLSCTPVLCSALLDSRSVFLELVWLMAERKWYSQCLWSKQNQLRSSWPFNRCTSGFVCFLKSASFF